MVDKKPLTTEQRFAVLMADAHDIPSHVATMTVFLGAINLGLKFAVDHPEEAKQLLDHMAQLPTSKPDGWAALQLLSDGFYWGPEDEET